MSSSTREKRVFIGVTAYDATVKAQCMLSLFNNIKYLELRGWEVEMTCQLGDCYVCQARNHLVNKFWKESKAPDFIFVDNDLQFSNDAMYKLLTAPSFVEIIGGSYPYRNPLQEGFPISPILDENQVPVGDRQHGILKCDHIPTGLMRITRSALDKMKDEKFVDDKGEYKWFRTGQLYLEKGDNRWWGEDVFFCKDAIEKGVTVWCEPRIDFGHIGFYTSTGNFDQYLRKGGAVQQRDKPTTGDKNGDSSGYNQIRETAS